MIIKTNQPILKNFLGEDNISKIYAGENLVFGHEEDTPVQIPNYMALQNIGQNTAEIDGNYISDDSTMKGMSDIYYSSDGTIWTLWQHNEPSDYKAEYNTITLQPGEKIYLKATGLGAASQSLTKYFQFIITEDYSIEGSGNILSLIYGDNFENQTNIPARAFFRTFEYCKGLTKTPDIIARTVDAKAFYNCFRGCSNLSYVKCLVEETFHTMSDFPFYGWLNNVSATGTFVKSADALWQNGDVIPSGWTVETASE